MGRVYARRASQRLLAQLDNKQIAALRFASDEELAVLLERAVRERLPPKEIKRAVKSWTADRDRTEWRRLQTPPTQSTQPI